jgi:hypothetical protein
VTEGSHALFGAHVVIVRIFLPLFLVDVRLSVNEFGSHKRFIQLVNYWGQEINWLGILLASKFSVVFSHCEGINLTSPAILGALVGLFNISFDHFDIDLANQVQLPFKVLNSVYKTGFSFADYSWVECQSCFSFNGGGVDLVF